MHYSCTKVQEAGHTLWLARFLQTCNMIIQSVGSVQFGVEQKHLLKIRICYYSICYYMHMYVYTFNLIDVHELVFSIQ